MCLICQSRTRCDIENEEISTALTQRKFESKQWGDRAVHIIKKRMNLIKQLQNIKQTLVK